MCVDVLDRRVTTVASFDERPAVPETKEEVQMVDEESTIGRMMDNGERRYNEAIMDLGCTATVAGRAWVEDSTQGSGAEIQRYSTEP